MNVFAELVRLPAVLSTPGDSLVGAAASPTASRSLPVAAGHMSASALLYLGGMALNDYADRRVDAVERPHRPIPSKRISERTALGVGVGLLAGGVLLAGLSGGKRGWLTGSALAATICTYDFAAKSSPAAPLVMATCRSLDVLLGAANTRTALGPAAVIGAHTLAITGVSRFEAEGGPAAVGKAALVATAAVSAAAVAVNVGRLRGKPSNALVALGSLATYAIPFAKAAREAVAKPEPRQLQKVVGTGVMGMIPLQGTLISGAGRPLVGAAVTALWPVAQRFRRKAT